MEMTFEKLNAKWLIKIKGGEILRFFGVLVIVATMSFFITSTSVMLVG